MSRPYPPPPPPAYGRSPPPPQQHQKPWTLTAKDKADLRCGLWFLLTLPYAYFACDVADGVFRRHGEPEAWAIVIIFAAIWVGISALAQFVGGQRGALVGAAFGTLVTIPIGWILIGLATIARGFGAFGNG